MARLTPIPLRELVNRLEHTGTRMATAVEVPGVFTPEECDRIIALREVHGFRSATVQTGDDYRSGDRKIAVDAVVRDTERTDVVAGSDHQWIYDRISSVFEQANREVWNFRLAYIEPIQLLRYPEGGHYTWHMDLGTTGPMTLRKVAATVLLSPVGAYDGGVLEIGWGPEPTVQTHTRGGAILFPAFQLHRVTRVTRGERFALVVWALGPKPLR